MMLITEEDLLYGRYVEHVEDRPAYFMKLLTVEVYFFLISWPYRSTEVYLPVMIHWQIELCCYVRNWRLL